MPQHIVLLTLFIFLTAPMYGQSLGLLEKCVEKDTIQGMEVMSFVEKMPTFKGGKADLLKYVMENLKYPQDSTESIQSRITVSFVIDTCGVVQRPVIIRPKYIDKLTSLETMVLRLVEEMPVWSPGLHLGQTVPVRLTFPLTFCTR